jgi:hypothetical protein
MRAARLYPSPSAAGAVIRLWFRRRRIASHRTAPRHEDYRMTDHDFTDLDMPPGQFRQLGG